MRKFQYVITDPEGIRANQAERLVKAAMGYTSLITLAKGGRSVNCKVFLGVMSLDARKGDEVTLTFDGTDENEAYGAIGKFMRENL